MPERFIDALRRGGVARPGVEQWSVYQSEQRGVSLGIKDTLAGSAHTPLSLSEGCGARYLLVWSDGLVSRGTLERRQLEQDARDALAQARAAAYDDPDAAQVRGPAEMPEVALHAPGAAALARGDTSPLAGRLAAVRRRVAQRGFATWSGSFSASEARARLATSAGLEADGRGTTAGWFVSFDGELGDGFSARELESDADFEARLDRLADLVKELKRPAEPMAPGVLPVILSPGVVEHYVIETVLHHLQGATVAHEESQFRREQFGAAEPVLREDLTLRLDPLEPLKSGSYRFTVEGVPAAPCSFIERGRLVQPILGLKYAKRLGLPPTSLPASMDTLHFEGATRLSRSEALERAAGGVLVLSVLGVHTQDTSSGDFSLSAPQTLRIGPDGHAGRLRCTISGNLFSVLRGGDLQFVEFEGEHTPGLLFRCRVDPK